MAQAAVRTRHNRTITVDFHDEATYLRLLNDGKAFVEFVLAFVRVRLGGSPSGASSVHGAKRSSRSSHTSSYAIARCDQTSPVMRCWRPTVGSVWNCARC